MNAPNVAAVGHCKGKLLLNLRSFVAVGGGESAWEALVAPAGSDAQVLGQRLLTGSWYPVGVWNRAVRHHLRSSRDSSSEMKRLSKYVADEDFRTVMKFLLSIASPDMILARSSMLWAGYFDTCTVRSTKLGPRSWLITIGGPTDDDEAPGAETCGEGLSGWLEWALRLCGAKAPSVDHRHCRFHGATECNSEVVWSD